MTLPRGLASFYTGPPPTDGVTAAEKEVNYWASPPQFVPITRLSVAGSKALKQLKDAAGGEMIVLAVYPKGRSNGGLLDSCWSVLVALCDARGAVVLRALKGAVFEKACKNARDDLCQHYRDVSLAKTAAVREWDGDQAPHTLSSEERILQGAATSAVATWGARIHDRPPGGFGIDAAAFSPDGWFNDARMPPIKLPPVTPLGRLLVARGVGGAGVASGGASHGAPSGGSAVSPVLL